MSEITIHLLGEIKTKRPSVVLGFPGTGLVGSVAASQMIDALGLEFIGYIASPDFAPLAAIHEYRPMPAARIHYSRKHNLVVILSEMSIPVASSSPLAEKILEFTKSLDAALVVSLGGISLKEEGRSVYSIATDQRLLKPVLDKKLVEPIREGATTGVNGILLARGSIEKLPIVSILAESSEEYLDPDAASHALRVLSVLLGIKIDTTRLDREAKEIAAEMREKIIKSKAPRKIAPGDTSMYG